MIYVSQTRTASSAQAIVLIEMFVKILEPHTLSADDLRWLLQHCDGVLEGNVCRCVTSSQWECLTDELDTREMEYETISEKPIPKPLGEYVTIVLAAWLRDQEREWRQHRYP